MRGVKVGSLPWPSKFQDINIIHNIWGVKAGRVNADATQSHNVDELVENDRDLWESESPKYIEKVH